MNRVLAHLLELRCPVVYHGPVKHAAHSTLKRIDDDSNTSALAALHIKIASQPRLPTFLAMVNGSCLPWSSMISPVTGKGSREL